MEVRRALNRLLLIAASIVIVLLVFLAFRWSGITRGQPVNMAFYTTDDGATFFADDLGKVPPFDHDGKPAVEAFVFTCDDGQHHFVQYLRKYSDEVKQQLEATHTTVTLTPGLIKRPGDAKWISETYPQASTIMTPKCPDGTGPGPIRPVWP
jgi:hypothetical protein